MILNLLNYDNEKVPGGKTLTFTLQCDYAGYVDVAFNDGTGIVNIMSKQYLSVGTTTFTYKFLNNDNSFELWAYQYSDAGGVNSIDQSLLVLGIHFVNYYINILSPDQNSIYNVDSYVPVTWSTNDEGSLNIYATYDNGKNWSLISTVNAQDNLYMWNIPNINSQLCKLKFVTFNKTVISVFPFVISEDVSLGNREEIPIDSTYVLSRKSDTNNIYKYFPPMKIDKYKTKSVFDYKIGHNFSDESLTSMFTAYSFNYNTGNYNSIRNAYYSNQTSDSKIVSSSYVYNKIGNETNDSVIVFSCKKFILKDGINSDKPEKNVSFVFSSIIRNDTTNINICYDSFSTNTPKYFIYDKKINNNEGYLLMTIKKGDLYGTMLKDFNYISELVVGRIFYRDGLIIIDSFQSLNYAKYDYNDEIFYYYAPYPKISDTDGNFSLTASNDYGVIDKISTNFNGIYFNYGADTNIGYYDVAQYDVSTYALDDNTTGFFISTPDSSSSLIIVEVEISCVLYKNTYLLNLEIANDDFAYSLKLIDNDGNVIPVSEANPIWFNKVGFYDYKNNLIGIGILNKPIKYSNERNISLTFKVDS